MKKVLLAATVLLLCANSVLAQQGASPLKSETIKGVKMVTLPAGSFNMGHEFVNDPSNPNKFYPDEQPVHKVILSSFQIGVTEITQAQYESVMGGNPSLFTKGDNYPVTNVPADSAVVFCNKLSKMAGLEPCYEEKTKICDFKKNGFRLPTEAEWEYACRAGSSGNYSSGNKVSDLDKTGWYLGNSNGQIHPVAQKLPNKWGIFDMHGNVWEICYDGFDEVKDYGTYPSGEVKNPIGSEKFNMRITRGGGFYSEASECTSSVRGKFWTGGGCRYLGFRVARSQ